jgi:hypothetical protein
MEIHCGLQCTGRETLKGDSDSRSLNIFEQSLDGISVSQRAQGEWSAVERLMKRNLVGWNPEGRLCPAESDRGADRLGPSRLRQISLLLNRGGFGNKPNDEREHRIDRRPDNRELLPRAKPQTQ